MSPMDWVEVEKSEDELNLWEKVRMRRRWRDCFGRSLALNLA
jgi:hypothetical protein